MSSEPFLLTPLTANGESCSDPRFSKEEALLIQSQALKLAAKGLAMQQAVVDKQLESLLEKPTKESKAE